jgi:hypothetical protein
VLVWPPSGEWSGRAGWSLRTIDPSGSDAFLAGLRSAPPSEAPQPRLSPSAVPDAPCGAATGHKLDVSS